ncbi:bifunctional 5,10-methylene-tetrahydrofolate dehydrogenase/5,10-methylene-tetrahydrofolate cyclohydrolase [Rossellomorea vietnamensis]|uniref:bifunctional 5,10-methylenetetrahydrofolate dehydrogenase/5,10-methenyltetrahydrofolate cyclohydrolase n=1 Tax=Rossellomorea vietnamensis TaxID=218284 RepID=UPI001CCEC51D|nr:tetrahydrofolate dehydrogenase/cyclohydrolase catalytic domain-containing protein [Rossellomorea vietnamensis]MCA0150384.1 bifunctional 5,10-methylene-tetrahydrofolate dehydrogenase/5,10-methylene-tetrahydrofolate cyclohydrolase [Rossellomorea vietnamensis]
MIENGLIKGQDVSGKIKNELEKRVKDLTSKGIVPSLATILVGDNPSSETYIKMKSNACRKIGIKSQKYHLPEESTTEELIDVIERLNADQSVHGILLQHPVPSQIDERAAFDSINIEKDVDGVTSSGFGRAALQVDTYPSCTPAAIMELINFYNIDVEGKHAVVVGRSPILGKPVSSLLLNRNATVTTCHSYTSNLEDILKQADIVIAAVGKPNFIKGEWLKKGAIVIDAGYNKGNIGDVDFESCEGIVRAITPVPGGVGPVTIAMLLKHTVEAAEKQSLNLVSN